VEDLPGTHYYGGVTVTLPQGLSSVLKGLGAAAVDLTFGVLGANPYAYTDAALRYAGSSPTKRFMVHSLSDPSRSTRINSGVVVLSIKSHDGTRLNASGLAQTIAISIPLVVYATVVESRTNRTGVADAAYGTVSPWSSFALCHPLPWSDSHSRFCVQ
jgi:hypothetical protein